jgi:3-oxoacyl-[acyl-carrier protein] reductase
MNLVGRSAIVTGASLGLGKAIAAGFLQAGASVLLAARGERALGECERELSALLHRPGQVLAALPADVSREEDCAAVVRRSGEVLPGLHVLVNNAGVYGPKGCIEEVDWSEWACAVAINLLGTALMCRAVLPLFRQQRYGKIINLSGGGATSPLPRLSAYASSKAAVVRLTETLAHEVRDTGIDVNAIAPGALNTRLLDEVLAAGPQRVGEEFYRKSLQQRQQGGTPLELGASLAVFLASARSDGISGRLLSAAWDDWQQLPGWRDELARSDIYTLRRITPEDRGGKWTCA